MDDLKTLTTLLHMTNEAWELASEIEKPERLRLLIEEMKGKAREERGRLKQDHQQGTRYDLCMTGILEELSYVGKLSWERVSGLDSRLMRVREEIERTIVDVKGKRRIM